MKNKDFIALPQDVFAYLLYYLPPGDIYSLQAVSHAFQSKIAILEIMMQDFWKNKAMFNWSEERVKSLENYNSLFYTHHYFQNYMNEKLGKSVSPYFLKTVGFLGFDYRLGDDYWDWPFSVAEISHYLVEDNPEKFFAAIFPIPEIAACLSQNHLDINKMKGVIQNSLDQLKAIKRDSVIDVEQLYFIGLLPFIIKARAVRCFDILIRAYFYLVIYFPEIDNPFLLPNALLELVFSTNDRYFKKELASIVLRIVPSLSPILYDVLDFYHKNEGVELVHEVMGGLSNRKLQNMSRYMKEHHLDHLRHAFLLMSEGEELTEDLRTLLTMGEVYLKNNNAVQVHVLEQMKKEINESFDKLSAFVEQGDQKKEDLRPK